MDEHEPAKNSWRPDLYVLARLIELIYKRGPLPRSSLQLYSRLNHVALQRYTDWMLARKLIAICSSADDPQVYALTGEGNVAYAVIVAWIKNMLDGFEA